MLKSKKLRTRLRCVRFFLVRLASRETRTCRGCGATHRRRNKCDNTFSATCTEACFERNLKDAMLQHLYGAY
jgi:hypothetical protein